MAVVNELVTKFSFQGSLKPLKDFQEDLKSSVLTIFKYSAAFGAATTATAIWVDSTLRGAESLVRLSEDTQIAIQQLQQMRLITAQNGVANETFEQSLVTLTQKIGEAATQGSDDFNRLGISVLDAEGNLKSTDSVLFELSKKFQTLSNAQQQSFAQRLGIDNNVIGAFQKSDAELKKLIDLANKFGLVTQKQTKELNKYYASIETLRFGFTAVSRQVALKFSPILQRLADNVTNFLADFGGTFATLFTEFIDGIGNILGFMNDLIEKTIGWKVALTGLAIAVGIAFAPITLIVGTISAILLIIEDLITAFKDGKSVIADFFQEFFGVDIVPILHKIIEAFDTVIMKIKEATRLSREFTLSLSASIGQDIRNLFDKASNLNPFGGNTTAPTPLPVTTNNNSTTSNTVNNTVNIEVKSNDPQAAGEAVSTALERNLENASFQFGKGGR